MRIKIISLFIIFVIGLSMVDFCKCQEAAIAIDPSSYTVSQAQIGTTFQININITDVTNLWSWKVRLNWNPDVLNVTGVTEGPFLKSVGTTLFPPPPQRPGYLTEIDSTLLSPSSANGSGVLVTVTFEALAAGQSAITINETQLLQPDGSTEIPFTVSNGQVVVLPEFPNLLFLVFILAATTAVILIKKLPKLTRQKQLTACQTQFG
jgi:hypothetical protein